MSSASVSPSPQPLPAEIRPGQRITPGRERLGRLLASGWPLAILIALGAAWLRFRHVGGVEDDPFYDAAVRSMSLSWHNFFFGAMEPGGSVSIDKPPLDLWLQVASVKLFGFDSTTLKLPEALGGTLAVLSLFAAVRRACGARAGLAAAAALAVLPVAVITSRSDTMDAVMAALLTLALLCVVRAGENGRTGWLLGAGAALGLAFNVKLTESLLALPALLVIACLALPGSRRRRALQLGLALAVYVVVSLSWLTATLAFPAHDRPWAYGSSNGSAWNASFVYNGIERIEGKPEEGAAPPPAPPPGGYPERTQEERDAIPITEPSTGRLLTRIGPLSGERLGLEVLVGLLLGLAAAASMLVTPLARRLRRRGGAFALANAPPPAENPGRAKDDSSRARVRRATLIGLLVWLVIGAVLFTHMARLHPRYTEGFTPAVAATLGIGLAWATARAGWWRLVALAVTLAVVVTYTERLLFGTPRIWWVAVAGAVIGLALAVEEGVRREAPDRRPRELARTGVLVGGLVCVLAVPLWASLRAVREDVTDSNSLGVVREPELGRLSSFLTSHQGGARYEVAYESASKIGALVVKDARPILILTSTRGRVLTPVARLRRLAAEGQVRYAILTQFCTPHAPRSSAECSAPANWIRAHGEDVSRRAGLGPEENVLWRLPVAAGSAT